jgi:GNAT superfamily N-acetyltransferase
MTAPETRSTSIVIRVARPSDVEALVGVFDEYRAFYRQQPNATSVEDFVTERLERNDSTIIVAIDASSGEPAGFVHLYPSHSVVRLRPSWILTDIYVASAHRGKGIARRLLHAASDHALKTGASPYPEAVSEDAPLRQMFDSLGHRAADWMMQCTIDL